MGVDPDDWLKSRVGSVHTFQGQEAQTVIAVLGAPKASQQGARGWAAYTPNVLNVMVSRAKQNFYVIGSHAAWAPVGHFRDLARSVHADSGLKRGRSSDGNSIPSPRTNAACANCALSH